jgi:hypothetical protein
MNSRVHEREWAIDFNERGFLEKRNMVLIVELDSGPGHADVGFIIVIVRVVRPPLRIQKSNMAGSGSSVPRIRRK